MKTFANTKEGRKEAEDYSRRVGGGGYWEDHVDTSEEGLLVEDAETKLLLSMAYVAMQSPELVSPTQAIQVGTKLAQKGIHIPGLPVDFTECLEGEQFYQPGEASWASWKCDGGPHTRDAFDFVHPNAQDLPEMLA